MYHPQVRELIDFIQDDDKLREERKKAKKNKDKYIGMSADAMGMRMGGSTGSYNDNWDASRRGAGSDRQGDRNWCKCVKLLVVVVAAAVEMYHFISAFDNDFPFMAR